MTITTVLPLRDAPSLEYLPEGLNCESGQQKDCCIISFDLFSADDEDKGCGVLLNKARLHGMSS